MWQLADGIRLEYHLPRLPSPSRTTSSKRAYTLDTGRQALLTICCPHGVSSSFVPGRFGRE